MNEIETLKLLKKANRDNDMVGILPKSDIGKCLIKALEEVQQYRAIGTPEKCLIYTRGKSNQNCKGWWNR